MSDSSAKVTLTFSKPLIRGTRWMLNLAGGETLATGTLDAESRSMAMTTPTLAKDAKLELWVSDTNGNESAAAQVMTEDGGITIVADVPIFLIPTDLASNEDQGSRSGMA